MNPTSPTRDRLIGWATLITGAAIIAVFVATGMHHSRTTFAPVVQGTVETVVPVWDANDTALFLAGESAPRYFSDEAGAVAEGDQVTLRCPSNGYSKMTACTLLKVQ